MKNMIINALLALLPPTRFFAVKRNLLRLLGITIGRGSKICGTVQFYGAGRVTIGKDCWIGIGCKFYTSINSEVIIGDCADIAPEVVFMCGSHEVGGPSRRAGKGKSANIYVGKGSWVGIRTLLLGGCAIEESCVVGANSLLLGGKYPSSSLIVGSPGKVVRKLDN
jgi:maltose O-acetyltransferase